MAKAATGFYGFFQPTLYKLVVAENHCQLFIEGRKLPPPSKRITLHQKGLKIISAKITRLDKRGEVNYEIVRINHLPTIEQVRLHTNEIMYPGPYHIEIEYRLSPEKLKALRALGDKKPDRTLLPSIDEPDAWAKASFEIN